jgi:hypothetical protein
MGIEFATRTIVAALETPGTYRHNRVPRRGERWCVIGARPGFCLARFGRQTCLCTVGRREAEQIGRDDGSNTHSVAQVPCNILSSPLTGKPGCIRAALSSRGSNVTPLASPRLSPSSTRERCNAMCHGKRLTSSAASYRRQRRGAAASSKQQYIAAVTSGKAYA